MNLHTARLIREIREHEAAGARPASDYLEELMSENEELHISIRPELTKQLDRLVDAISRDVLVAPGGPLSREEVAQLAMAHGIDALTAMHVE